MKSSTRWGLIVSLVAATGVAMVLAFLLSIATDNRLFYEQHFQWLFWVNLLVAALLMLVIGIAATRLLVRVQRGKFGSRLLLKLAAIFALVGVLPGLLIYTVSYQFVSRGIESWFDVKVEGALDAGLALGRGTLDAQVNDLASKTQLAADRLGEGRGEVQALALERLREDLAAENVAIVNSVGQVLLAADRSAELLGGRIGPRRRCCAMRATAVRWRNSKAWTTMPRRQTVLTTRRGRSRLRGPHAFGRWPTCPAPASCSHRKSTT